MRPDVILYAIAAALFAVFCFRFWRERRRLSNGVFLGLSLTFGAIGVVATLNRQNSRASDIALAVLVLSVPLLIVLLGGFLIVTGALMVRREGRSLAKVLSLLVGVALVGYVIGVVLMMNKSQPPIVEGLLTAATLVLGYIGFVFVAYFGYAMLYRRLSRGKDVDFIIVLGCGIIGTRVTPLLASRLDRGYEIYRAEGGAESDVRFITSGGQGPGEDIAEAVAMRGYLLDRGVPEDSILVEDQSRTTQENLRFSKEIIDREKSGARAVVVTNDFHAFRAATYARRVKLPAQVVGAPTAMYFLPNATIREFVAILAASKLVHVVICALLIWFALNRAL